MAGFMTLSVWEDTGALFNVPDEGEQFLLLDIGEANKYEQLEPSQKVWFAQYSASGYMDQTDPVHGTTAEEALTYCFELYGDAENPAEVAEYEDILAQIRARREG